MTEFLKDWFIPVMSLLVTCTCGFVPIIVTIVIFLVGRRKKSIMYEVLTNTSLVEVKKEIRGKLRTFFEDKPVERLNMILLRITNDGNIPVSASDFEEPLKFMFEGESQILSIEVSDKVPSTLNPQLDTEQNQVTLRPMLLNENDSFIIKILVAQYEGILKATARIIGVKEIKQGIIQSHESSRPSSELNTFLLSLSTATILSVLLAWLLLSTNYIKFGQGMTPEQISLVLPLFFCISAVLIIVAIAVLVLVGNKDIFSKFQKYL